MAPNYGRFEGLDGPMEKRYFFQPKVSEPVYKRIYVMDGRGEFYLLKDVIPEFAGYSLNHTSPMAGGPVAGAGMIRVGISGMVREIDTSSGHYKPRPEALRASLDSLYRKGFDLSETRVRFGGNKDSAGSYLSRAAMPFLFHTRESRDCMRRQILDSESLRIRDLQEYRAVSKRRFYALIFEAALQGKLERYRPLLHEMREDDLLLRAAWPLLELDRLRCASALDAHEP